MLNSAAASVFAFFPALAVSAGAAFPASERSAASDLRSLHASWAEQHVAWRVGLGLTPLQRIATGWLCGLALGVALSVVLVLYKIARTACADREHFATSAQRDAAENVGARCNLAVR